MLILNKPQQFVQTQTDKKSSLYSPQQTAAAANVSNYAKKKLQIQIQLSLSTYLSSTACPKNEKTIVAISAGQLGQSYPSCLK